MKKEFLLALLLLCFTMAMMWRSAAEQNAVWKPQLLRNAIQWAAGKTISD